MGDAQAWWSAQKDVAGLEQFVVGVLLPTAQGHHPHLDLGHSKPVPLPSPVDQPCVHQSC